MNHDTKHPPLPSLVGTVLTDGNHYIDNLLAAAWKTLRLNQLLLCAGFSKRHGIEVTETVFVLMVWKWLNVSSVAMFCRNALGMFSRAKKDVLYDFLKREDINWRKFNMDTAKEVYKQQGLGDSRVKAFVLDDSVKARRGKKMEGVSSHYDHVTNRHVMGQQAHQSPHFKYQMTPNIPRYTRCSISIRPNASINARTRYSGQFGTCSYSINP